MLRQLLSKCGVRVGSPSPRRSSARSGVAAIESLEDRTMLSAGTLDATFGSGGVVTTDLGGSDFVHGSGAIAVQPDGRVIAVATSGPFNNSDFAVLRYLEDGSLDSTFGVNGAAVTDIGGNDFATDVVIQPDGKVIVSGRTEVVGNTNIRNSVLVRYNSDGTLDTTFGSGGIVVADFLPGGLDQFQDLDLQLDGRIVTGVLAGSFGIPSDFLVARFNANGTLDGTFGTAGQTSIDFGAGSEFITRVSVQSDDAIVVGGRTPFGGGLNMAIARLTSDGGLDASFGTGGKVILSQAGLDVLESLGIDSQGRIVAGGNDLTGTQASLVRLTSSGSLDPSFGGGGFVTTSLGSSRIFSLAIQSNDAIVVALDQFHTPSRDFAIARFTVNGLLDTQFGTGGVSVVNAGNGIDELAAAVAVRGDGSIVAAGFNQASVATRDIMVARFLGDNITPEAMDDEYEANEDNVLVVDAAAGLLANDTDADSDPLVVTQILSGPAHGVLDWQSDGSFTYLPAADFHGSDTFTYEISDGNGGTSTAVVTLNVRSSEEQIVALIDEIEALVAEGDLNSGQGNSLLTKLNGALQKLDSNATAATNKLEALINQITALATAGIIDDPTAALLIASAETIINSI